ncbi:Zn finger protein HypA/HybF [Halalkaliarchaeum sp. AArc-CO]|uniref:hydrogenase maturation nickel metallochaperone HypA/HybF n=1 Tax=unclassified Halalkaliarchaeum TaxID=2678344 RepID=UPI00217F0683|nr:MULTISPECIES: hydrogenase maturation nickel metallochaperone HypA [unclassified Halalkaliarchaeum]MDR5672184.1 hydrogenase maturation nickel metallochaperone HypA [Halalkaliarchaeum sp. AArc-GB]UWG51690.1 Zn finger protein HypA/HybF [Halalkaliarchaeum sp. AArc-CO]
MHEISVASGILDRAITAAEEHGADRIDAITIEIGRATHVNPEQLVFCLETIADGTAGEGATVRTETVDPVAVCDCGWRDEPDDLGLVGGFAPDVRCPECGERTELVRGRECRLASIEVPEAGDRTEQTATQER